MLLLHFRHWRPSRPHRSIYYNPTEEHQCDGGHIWSHSGVCGQCKVCVCVCTSTQNDLYQTIKTQFCLFVSFRPILSLIPRLCLSVFLSRFTSRPLIKLSITWRKNGVLVNRGLRDFGRRLTISGPLVSDSGYYECEASLRSSSAPSVSAGAYLHVLGNLTFLLPVKHYVRDVFKMCLVQKVFILFASFSSF